MIQIIKKDTEDKNYKSLEMKSNKKTALVIFNPVRNEINTICKNASHKAYRGFGKFFQSWEDAKKHYKSADMKAMINFAEAEFTK